MKIRNLLVATAMTVATLNSARAVAQTLSFLGSATNTWIGYNPVGSAPPTLNTTAPGSITGPVSGFRYARSSDAAGAFSPAPLFRTGDAWRFQFDGILGNNTTFRLEFSNPTRTSAFVLAMQNATAAGGDALEVDSLGTPGPTSLFAGDFGGAAGGTQRIFGNVTLTIQSGTTALIAGTLSDSTGVRWNTPVTMDLGNTAPTLYAALNINNGSVTAINTLSWTFTAVPEPGPLTLAGLGLVGLGLSRWRSARKR